MKTRQIRKGEQEKRIARMKKRVASKVSLFDKNGFIKEYNDECTENSVLPKKIIPICDEACHCGLCKQYKNKIVYCYDPWTFEDDSDYNGCSSYYAYASLDAEIAHYKDLLHEHSIYKFST